MIEKAPQEINFRVLTSEIAVTKLGIVEKCEVVYKGVPQTIYTIAGKTDSRRKTVTQEIISAEKAAKKQRLIKNLKAKGTTPDKFIEKASYQFITDVLKNKA